MIYVCTACIICMQSFQMHVQYKIYKTNYVFLVVLSSLLVKTIELEISVFAQMMLLSSDKGKSERIPEKRKFFFKVKSFYI